jgi:hypothetical protein
MTYNPASGLEEISVGMRSHDHEDLDETKRVVRDRVPEAVSIGLQTSDQGSVGFTLVDIETGSGVELSSSDSALLDLVADEVWHLVSSLGWNGLVGEDQYGYATVSLQKAE